MKPANTGWIQNVCQIYRREGEFIEGRFLIIGLLVDTTNSQKKIVTTLTITERNTMKFTQCTYFVSKHHSVYLFL